MAALKDNFKEALVPASNPPKEFGVYIVVNTDGYLGQYIYDGKGKMHEDIEFWIDETKLK